MESLVAFLSEIPQFGGGGTHQSNSQLLFKNLQWTKSALSKLSLYMNKVQYRRGNVVYSKGDDCQFIYIIFEGEYELIKTIKLKEQRNDIQ